MLVIVVIERVAIFITGDSTKSIISEVIQNNWSNFFY